MDAAVGSGVTGTMRSTETHSLDIRVETAQYYERTVTAATVNLTLCGKSSLRSSRWPERD